MRFQTHNGWYEEERERGSVWEIDVRYSLAGREDTNDDLKDVLNYECVYNAVSEEMKRQSKLLETAGKAIYDRILEIGKEYEITSLQVRVRKLAPPFGGETDSVEIIMEETL